MTLPLIPYPSTSAALEQPMLRQLGPNLYLLMFRLMKLVPAKFIIDQALARGKLPPGGLVMETSSGTFALGLAIVCCERGLPFVIFSDPIVDRGLRRQLELLGGEVCIIEQPAAVGGFQQARLDALDARLAAAPGAFWSRQYSNPDNARAYAEPADQLRAALGDRLTLVGTVGSGGSTGGMAARLRATGAACRLVGVDTFHSVLFGQPDGPRLLRGLGNSLLPPNVDHAAYDEIHWVSAEAGFNATRHLMQAEAVFAGPTTGAAHLVARWHAAAHPDETVVFVGADEGHRYLATVYDRDWLAAAGLRPDAPLPAQPVAAPRPAAAGGDWACFAWNRRSLREVADPA
ncbi:pyridoxal-phosphate dependent enzyme [Azorhizobium doebereinerae]|uniref:pyridoxal-phosphate dependent enzyme n=1 Tax=Azorhizobium doebereinerae TaxID=281091 RepID=UPI0004908F7D|nr:pyridoxal-phosphate dependent enzyme [Azorhizobium doebereinerae]